MFNVNLGLLEHILWGFSVRLCFSAEVQSTFFSILPVYCVLLFCVRGQQYIAQTPAPASILHAPGRSKCWQQLCLWSLIQSPQLLQLLWYFHEPFSIQQPHESCWQWTFSTGQSNKLSLSISHLQYSNVMFPVNILQSCPLLSLFIICNCIWLKLKFRNSMFSKITASVGFYVHLPKPWIYFSYSKLLHL